MTGMAVSMPVGLKDMLREEWPSAMSSSWIVIIGAVFQHIFQRNFLEPVDERSPYAHRNPCICIEAQRRLMSCILAFLPQADLRTRRYALTACILVFIDSIWTKIPFTER
jgi:hypothetical protein